MYQDETIDILQLDQSIQSGFDVITEEQPIDLSDIQLSRSFQDKLDTVRASVESDPETVKNFYLLDTVEIIQAYKQTLQTPIKINFLDNHSTVEEEPSDKTHLIHQYIEKVKDYNLFNGSYSKPDPSLNVSLKNKKCTYCKSTELTESVEFSGIIICLNCGTQETTMNLANSIRLTHNDAKRVNICSKYSYDKKSHFLNCINQYQGKHKSGIDEDTLAQIEKEIEKYNLIDQTKRNRKAKYRNVTKEHIFLFVKELKLTKCYGDINLIHHLITGHPLNDISHLTEKLLQDFDQFVQMHHKLFPNEIERKNFNYQQLLYQLLVRHKYPCNPAEFNFLKTIDRKYYHDEICQTIFENLGWNYSSLF
jgi:hypothetical protein